MRIIITFFFSFALTSCISPVFIPKTQNIPLFSKKNQMRFSSSLSATSLDVQAAYAPVNNLGLILNAQVYKAQLRPEFAVGGFCSFSEKLIGELYGGYGGSHLKFKKAYPSTVLFQATGENSYDTDIHSHYFFIQPSIGIQRTERRNISFSLKTCYWVFPHYYYDHEYWEYGNSNGSLRTLKFKDSISTNNGRQITFEPAITFRRGCGRAKFMLQLGGAILQEMPRKNLDPYKYSHLFVRMGINFFLDFNK